ncbi:MAG: hypothetical protein IKD55_13540 [Sediminibacterium sp.]|nr:hypothetical protein [Sediminibacterium sp.]
MKKLIEAFIESNDSIVALLNTTGRKYENADEAISSFEEALKQSKFNPALGLSFATILQFLKEPKNIEHYDLADISNLFASLLKVQSFTGDTYLEAANFEWSVMDNVENAKTIALVGLERAKQNVHDLQDLLQAIEVG